MNQAKGIYRLRGTVQNYDWGGYEFLPELLGINNEGQKPFAEYWMGTHPKSPSVIITAEGEKPLDSLVTLPYLFKILDVKDMLSIQVHPSKTAAEIEFARENNERIPLDAPHRNYKDDNHKPELACAISEFWLLHGFKKEKELNHLLQNIPEFNTLLPIFANEGYEGLYKKVMGMPQAAVNEVLQPLLDRILPLFEKNTFNENEEDYWAAKAALTFNKNGNADRGIFSVYFFNIVKLSPGEAIFQDAGIPHAYLRGQCAEIMANSDNVLRGGLTGKHIDVKELMKHVLCRSVVPHILRGEPVNSYERIYETPAPDFELHQVNLKGGEKKIFTSKSTEILFLLSGKAVLNESENTFSLKPGEAAFVVRNVEYSIESALPLQLFRAAAPFPNE